MSERPPQTDNFDSWGSRQFGHLTTQQLIHRLESGEAFKTDDEEVELSRRLAASKETYTWDGPSLIRVKIDGLPQEAQDEIVGKLKARGWWPEAGDAKD